MVRENDLIKSILGMVIPETGTISIDKQIVKGDWNYRSRMGCMPQMGRYPDNMTIEQVINMITEIRKDKLRPIENYMKVELDRIGKRRCAPSPAEHAPEGPCACQRLLLLPRHLYTG